MEKTITIQKDGKPTQVPVVIRYAVTYNDNGRRDMVNRTGPTPETKAQAELSLRDLLTNNTPGRLAEFFGPDPQFEVTPVTCYAESGYVFQIGAHEGAMTREFLHENGTLAESKITYEEYDYEGSRFVCAWVSPKLTENIQGGWVVYKK